MRQRSSYPKPFKAQVVQECLKPGASVSSVAISHGINANVIRKWLPIYRDKPVAPLYAIHKPHLPSGGATVYRCICGEQFHGSNASYSSTDEACGNRSSTWRSHV